MPLPRVNDQEFIELWRTHKNATEIAKILNIGVTKVRNRRQRIEVRYRINLPSAAANSPAHLRPRAHPHKYDLGILNGQIIVFSDAHFWPGIRTTAFKGLLRLIKELKPKAVINNGDAFDGASISRHPRIGWDSVPSVIEELKACEASLGEIQEAAGHAKLIWCLGNHCARFETRLAANAPQFERVKGFSLKDHFPAWHPCWSVWNGNTVIKHRYKGGIHATHNNVLNAGVNIVTGHLHSLKVTPFDDYNQFTRYGIDTGTLAEPSGPQFRDYTEEGPLNWRSGFVVLTYVDGRLMLPEIAKKWDDDHIEFRGQILDVSDL